AGVGSRRRAAAARRSRTDLTYLTPAELAARAQGFLPLLDELCAAADLAADRLVPLESPAAARALWDLSRTVVRSADLQLYFDGGVAGILERLDGSPSTDAKAFLDAFDTFLYEHGSLGPGPWDIGADVWETDPEAALREVDGLRSTPDAGAPEAATPEDAAPDDGSPPDGDGGPSAAAAARVLNEIRIALRELGRQMADAHHIGAPDLVMMLTADELDDFVAHPETFGLRLAQRAAVAASRSDTDGAGRAIRGAGQ
ncbi:MAG: rifampicin phosphotransferase, partial [Actinomycetota bacterium]|nr:rifampicin phosphotransferase [Actinomycetota bacterium]